MTVHNESGFAAGARIIAGDDGTDYDNIAMALHWATALLVVVQFLLAEIWDYFARPTDHATGCCAPRGGPFFSSNDCAKASSLASGSSRSMCSPNG